MAPSFNVVIRLVAIALLVLGVVNHQLIAPYPLSCGVQVLKRKWEAQ